MYVAVNWVEYSDHVDIVSTGQPINVCTDRLRLRGPCEDGRETPCTVHPTGFTESRTSSGVRLCWELEEPKGPKGSEPGSGCI